jgi:hypothetical protein
MCLVVARCSGVGFAVYCARELTAKAMLGCDTVAAYIRLLMICWYAEHTEMLAVLLKGMRCVEDSIGVVMGLHPANPKHVIMLVMYCD